MSTRTLNTVWLLAIGLFLGLTSASENACGQIINEYDVNYTTTFPPRLVYECLTSVPFNAAVASRYIAYWNDTLKFQSTTSYLKDPPSGYQQHKVDLFDGLTQIQSAIDAGSFPSQYEFEVALYFLLKAAHDGHLSVEGGALAVFTFGSPLDIVFLSVDGVEAPKVYLADDVYSSDEFTSYQPSAVTTINGQDVVSYLDAFAANNSYGVMETHADWNQLMISGSEDIQDYFNYFNGDSVIYPGDNLTFGFENGTSLVEEFAAYYWSQGPTGALETGGDFYNFFVLGWYPASFNLSSTTSDDGDASDYDESGNSSSTAVPSATVSSTASATISATPTASGWNESQSYPWYPAFADVYQPDLDLYSGGWLTGYFLNTSSTAVLSIPSFDMYGEALNTAQTMVDQFLNQSLERGVEKIVIDLQHNWGGEVLLAFDMFRRFFPNIEPFGGSRMRAMEPTNIMGEVLTQLVSNNYSEYSDLVAHEWVSTARIDSETNETFTSWQEFYGPHAYNGDQFTAVQRYNLTNKDFINSALDNSYDNFTVYSPDPSTSSPPYKAADIVLLVDGVCSSTCALFAEMMHHEAGVQVVAVGGRPTTGPMQGVSGSRGARSMSLTTLDAHIEFVQEDLVAEGNASDANFLPNRTAANEVYTIDASINLRDQIRKGEDANTPTQFLYEAADCRIFWTPATVFNYSALWQYVADAIWKNSTLCVAGSTVHASKTASGSDGDDDSGTTTSSATPALSSSSTFNISSYLSTLTGNGSSTAALTDELDDTTVGDELNSRVDATQYSTCQSNKDCQTGQSCKQLTICSASKKVCADDCTTNKSRCGGNGVCEVVSGTRTFTVGNQKATGGFCSPTVTATLCASTKKAGSLYGLS